ncbi:MAG TPA: glycosyltransferase [Thermodesulfobacteriota bacterium]|nr:glycosyltransferase [Thermodesulfobacteriota bacterium]
MDLTVIIPARSEEFLGRTIQDLLENIEGETEIIAILDGYLPDPPLPVSEKVKVIYNPVSVGQRVAANQAAKLAKGKYVMKVDAHCAFDKGFDVKMLQAYKELDDNVTMIPVMRNLHAFDWVCKNGHRRYQSPSGMCEECKEPTIKDVVWIPKRSPQTFTFRFDKTMHFQYDGGQAKKPESLAQGDFRETLSIQGSCFMCTKAKYFELDLCSEEFNSWGQQGVEVACKTWLSGGRVIANLRTWYAHMFRTRGGDFGFPYPNPQDKVNENREKSRQMFQKDKWPLATRKFQWLLDKFNPPDWTITSGAIFYTDNQLDEKIARPVRDQLSKISKEKKISITCSSLKKMDFGDKNVRFPSMKRGYLTMFKQILGALEKSSDNIIFFTEHDVLYHPSHFDFKPPKEDVFYYNQNVWLLRATDGHALHYDVNQLSGLCVYRDAAITHFRERFELAEQKFKELSEGEFNGWVRHCGFEPFTHGRIKWKNQFKYETWMSEFPNVDIKHGANATGQRWKKEQYRNQQLLINWQESENYQVSGWDSKDLIALN